MKKCYFTKQPCPENTAQYLNFVRSGFNFLSLLLQYGVMVDMYSLSVIIFELFSGMNPFHGNIFQIWQAKIKDEKPIIPLEFPADLKNLVSDGWSIKPRERPEIGKFRSALSLMLQLVEEKQLTNTNVITSMGNSNLFRILEFESKFD